jgi:hypothetical protein
VNELKINFATGVNIFKNVCSPSSYKEKLKFIIFSLLKQNSMCRLSCLFLCFL